MRKSTSKKSTLSQDEIRARFDNNQTIVNSWDEFHQGISRTRDSSWIFRGVSSPSYYPMPSIGREKIYGPYKRAQEQHLFAEFKKRAMAIIADPRLDDWHWLAYAQHTGVPTRLLDWSTSPLIAAFFALESNNEEDRLIYCSKYSSFIHEVVSDKSQSPFDNLTEGRFSPPFLFDRLRAQRGVFTIHPDPTKIFYHPKMKVIRIPHRHVEGFRKILFKYGFDYWSVYPDAEGLGQQLKWQYKNKIGLGSLYMSKP